MRAEQQHHNHRGNERERYEDDSHGVNGGTASGERQGNAAVIPRAIVGSTILTPEPMQTKKVFQFPEQLSGALSAVTDQPGAWSRAQVRLLQGL